MRVVSAIIFCVLASTLIAAAHHKTAGGAAQSSAPATSAPAASQENIQELRKDVGRMRALVQQMETNLAFVDTTQSPLKHQFQLEIDMWKTLIDHMERRLETSNPR